MSDRRERLRQQAHNRQAGQQPYQSIDADLIAAVQAAEQQGQAGAIVPAADGTIAIGKFKLTAIGIEISEGITEEEADALGDFLMQVEESRQWWLGDWANSYIDLDANQYEASAVYKRLSERFGISAKTLKDYAYVCRNVPASVRTDGLSFSHHKLVVGRDDMQELLQWAVDEGASVKALRERIKEIDAPTSPPSGGREASSNPHPLTPSPLHGEGEQAVFHDDMPSSNANALRELPLEDKAFTDAESTSPPNGGREASSNPLPLSAWTPQTTPSPLHGEGGHVPSTITQADGKDAVPTGDTLVGQTVVLPNGVVGKVEEELEGWLKVRLQNGAYTSVPADVVTVARHPEGFIVNREMVMAIGSLAEALRTVLVLEQGADADTSVYDKALQWCEWLLGLTYAKARGYEVARLEKALSDALRYLTAISEDATLYFEDVTAKAIHDLTP